MKFLVILEIVLLASQLQYVCVESNLATSLIKAGSRTAGTVTKNLVGDIAGAPKIFLGSLKTDKNDDDDKDGGLFGILHHIKEHFGLTDDKDENVGAAANSTESESSNTNENSNVTTTTNLNKGEETTTTTTASVTESTIAVSEQTSQASPT